MVLEFDKWDPLDPTINEYLVRESPRNRLTIEDQLYNYIPLYKDSKSWSCILAFDLEHQAIVLLCCTQMLWFIVLEEVCSTLQIDPHKYAFRDYRDRFTTIDRVRLQSQSRLGLVNIWHNSPKEMYNIEVELNFAHQMQLCIDISIYRP